jgi:hypothetical protein
MKLFKKSNKDICFGNFKDSLNVLKLKTLKEILKT